MTVFKNRQRGGRWAYDFWSGGRRFTGYCIDEKGKDATSESRAREIEGAVKRTVRARKGIVASGNTTNAFGLAQALLLHIESQVNSSPLHVANLELYAREILEFFGQSIAVVDVTSERVEQYRAFCMQQGLKVWKGGSNPKRDRRDPRWWGRSKKKRSAASANHYLDCLRAALGLAHAVRDPLTGLPMLPFPPVVRAVEAPKRQPTPIPAGELTARLELARPWVRDAAELARLFGLRRSEALGVTVDHVNADRRALRFVGEEAKSGRDEFAFGGVEGWDLLRRLVAQARKRGVRHLVTWPGPVHWRAVARGEKPEGLTWVQLKSIRRAWRTTGKGIAGAHRFHDLRARYVTEIAKSASTATTQAAARHADPSTTARYTAIASDEVSAAVERAAQGQRVFGRRRREH